MNKALLGLTGLGILLSGSVAMADVMQINIDSILVQGRAYDENGVPQNTLPTDTVGTPQTLTPNTYMGPDGIVDSNAVGNVANILNLATNSYFFNSKTSTNQELTFVISGADDVQFDPFVNNFAFLYSLGTKIDIYSDMSPNYNVFDGSGATEGSLVLSLATHEQFFAGTSDPYGLEELYNYGSNEYVGTALFDVVGGDWASAWDTNSQLLGSDLAFSFSLDDAIHGQYTLSGTANGVGATTAPVPEPTTMLLFGTGLIGLVGVARRKMRK